MAREFIIGGAEGFNPGVDSAYAFTDADGNVFKMKATEDIGGFEVTRNGNRTQPLLRVVAKTAAYTVLTSDHGTMFTTEGASGTVAFTLPATAALPTGWYCDFYNAAGQTMTVATGTADTGVAFNELDADSVTFSTSSELIGSAIRATKITGTLVAFTVSLGAETATPTVAD